MEQKLVETCTVKIDTIVSRRDALRLFFHPRATLSIKASEGSSIYSIVLEPTKKRGA